MSVQVEITQVVQLRRRPLPDMIQRCGAGGVALPLTTILEHAKETRYSGSVVLHFHNGEPVKIETGRPAAAPLAPGP